MVKRRSSSKAENDRGQAMPFMAVTLALAGALLLIAVRLTAPLHDAARARTAADAAVLAGAAEDEDTAAELATSNGGVLEEFVRRGPEVEVVVRVGGARARARARARVEWLPGSP